MLGFCATDVKLRSCPVVGQSDFHSWGGSFWFNSPSFPGPAPALLPHGPTPPRRDQLRETARLDPCCLRFGIRLPKRGRLHPAVGVPASLERRRTKPSSSEGGHWERDG